jgi:hypothetical protein
LICHPAELIGLRAHCDADIFDFRVVALDCVKRHDQLAVFDRVASEQPARRFLHHADDAVNFAIDFYLFVERRKSAE